MPGRMVKIGACEDREDGVGDEGEAEQPALMQALKSALVAEEGELVPANIQEEVDAEASEWARE